MAVQCDACGHVIREGEQDKYASDYVQELEAQLAEVREDNDRLTLAIRWACGESPEGTPEFPVSEPGKRYAWRTELRLLSGVRYIPPDTKEKV